MAIFKARRDKEAAKKRLQAFVHINPKEQLSRSAKKKTLKKAKKPDDKDDSDGDQGHDGDEGCDGDDGQQEKVVCKRAGPKKAFNKKSPGKK